MGHWDGPPLSLASHSPGICALHKAWTVILFIVHLRRRALSKLAAAPGQRGQRRICQVVCVRLPLPPSILRPACFPTLHQLCESCSAQPQMLQCLRMYYAQSTKQEAPNQVKGCCLAESPPGMLLRITWTEQLDAWLAE